MRPIDRRQKTATVSRPPSGFDAPANSGSIPRTPWEREDDDAFGPPPALDLAPGDAESEAKRMIYERTHPLHEAIMQNAHLDHDRAMRRYASLMRRAWDPAARDTPVQPARIIRDDGLARPAASAPVRGAPLTPPPPSRATDPMYEPKPAMLPATVPVPHNDFGKSHPLPRQAVESGSVVTQTPPPRPQEFGRRGDLPRELSSNDLALPADVLADRAEGARQAQQRVLASQRGADSATLPPYAIPYSTFLAAKEAIEARDDLSDSAKHVMLGLIGFEDLSHDTAGGSSAGITSDTFAKYKQFVSAYRRTRDEDPIAAENVNELTTDELLDFQYVYLVVELDPDIDYSSKVDPTAFAELVADSDAFDKIGSGALAFQIADCVFNYNPKNGVERIQTAFNLTLARMPAEYREANGYERLRVDGKLGDKTSAGIAALANDPRYKDLFLDWLRIERSLYNIDWGTYTGNNRRRIWGISHPHTGG